MTRSAPLNDVPTLTQIEAALRDGWARDTTDDPDVWLEENPALGQCGMSSLVIRALLGGDILMAPVFKADGSATTENHAWNRLPSGEEVDFTLEQFTEGQTLGQPIVQEPWIDGDPDRAKRLAARVAQTLGVEIDPADVEPRNL